MIKFLTQTKVRAELIQAITDMTSGDHEVIDFQIFREPINRITITVTSRKKPRKQK